MKKLYLWLLEKSKHPRAPWYLAFISFTESFISFIPPDPMMVPMIVAHKERAWFLAFLTTATSVLGGAIGYAIGFYLFERLGVPVLKAYGLMDKLSSFQEFFNNWGFWAIIIKAFTPIPFKLVTITAGALKFNFGLFMLASLLSRGLRFYLEAAIVWKFGEKMNEIIQENVMLVSTLFLGLLIGGFFIIKYIC
ncbi:DedA family protein [Alphaproteobacteria bacterium]|nr:DedA family protein [Alphaproteobacteria bacterium]